MTASTALVPLSAPPFALPAGSLGWCVGDGAAGFGCPDPAFVASVPAVGWPPSCRVAGPFCLACASALVDVDLG